MFKSSLYWPKIEINVLKQIALWHHFDIVKKDMHSKRWLLTMIYLKEKLFLKIQNSYKFLNLPFVPVQPRWHWKKEAYYRCTIIFKHFDIVKKDLHSMHWLLTMIYLKKKKYFYKIKNSNKFLNLPFVPVQSEIVQRSLFSLS